MFSHQEITRYYSLCFLIRRSQALIVCVFSSGDHKRFLFSHQEITRDDSLCFLIKKSQEMVVCVFSSGDHKIL